MSDRIPSYRRHKASGQAIVTRWSGLWVPKIASVHQAPKFGAEKGAGRGVLKEAKAIA
jgi:hypothetical protein